jgi:hypothetical protein
MTESPISTWSVEWWASVVGVGVTVGSALLKGGGINTLNLILK